jgi:DNA polymerase-3 subunit alpha
VSDSFVHLHAHTEYSMLDGAAKVRPLLAKAVALGQPAVASTDHGNVFSHYEMWNVAREMRDKQGADIRPILGCELYVAPASRHDKKKIYFGAGGKKAAKKGTEDLKDVSGDGAFTHMTMLAGNAQGLRAMFELTSRASKEGFYQKPRVDAELVAECIDNWPGAVLIGTTGCPSGAVQTRLRLGQLEEAEKEVAIWRDILGEDNYFLELMDHGNTFEAAARGPLMELAARMGLPLLATNDSHYIEADQAEMHDALLCIQMGRKIHETDRMKFDGKGYHLRDAAEMRRLFKDLPEACDNTLAIAERIAVDAYDEVFLPRTDLLPQFPVPEGHTAESFLRERVVAGLQRKYPDPAGPEQIRQDAHDRVLGYEFPTVVKQGYPDYMLMVGETTDWARSQRIRVGPGRGSAAGSGLSYALDITTVPTLEHGLLFERFINPERVSPPDVDVDFEQRRRDEVFRHLMEFWGEDRVCRIQTLGKIKAKAAIKDAARVLDVPFAVGARMTAAYPKAISGFDAALACVTDPEHDRYHDAEEFRQVLAKEEGAQKVFDLAVQLEGLVRSAGVHACGIVVSSQPLMGLIPMVWSDKDQQWVSGFPNAEVLEPMGLLKMDCLGLDTMDVIQHTVDDIAERYGVDVEHFLTELDDMAAFAELASGHTVGMFQVASGGMAKLLAQMRADRFEDISAGLALYRPGPMGAEAHTAYALRKTGRERVKAIHPELEDVLLDILGPTYGVICYQEQVMRAVQAVAGYSLGEADLLRKAMGKKKPEVLAKEKPKLFERMAANGYSEEAAQALWDIFLPFSAYAFNIAHTVSYGFITYATAWLKAHYPAEFMAALLTQAGDDADKKAMYLAECRRMGITVLVPDVNESGPSFTPISKTEIRFGLNAVSGLGAKAVPGIISGRGGRPYTSFADFLERIPLATCAKTAVAALIRGGAFDSLGHTRRALLECYEHGVGQHANVKKKEAFGQFDLFSVAEEVNLVSVEIPDVPEWDKEIKLQLERDALGLYVSGHPLEDDEPMLAGNRTMTIGELLAAIAVDEDGQPVDPSVTGAVLAGQIVSVNRWNAKTSGKPCAKIVLADLDSQVEIMAFSRALAECGHGLIPDTKRRIKVSLWQRDEGEPATICVDDVAELDPALTGETVARNVGPRPVFIVTEPEIFTRELAQEVRRILLEHPGERPLHFKIGQQDWVPEGWLVSPDVEFLTEVKELLGRESVKL